VLAVAFVPFLLALLACLPVPIGNPEKGRIDAELTGAWLAPAEGDDKGGVFLLEPYDTRTWLVSTVGARTDRTSAQTATPATPPADGLAGLERDGLEFELAVYKGWLTRIQGVRFLVLEPKLSVTDTGMTPTLWFAYRIARPAPDTLELRALKSDRGEFTHVTTTAEAEAVIGTHLDDPEFYDAAFSLSRVATSDYARVRTILGRVTKNQE
jgi:hypothetical protein